MRGGLWTAQGNCKLRHVQGQAQATKVGGQGSATPYNRRHHVALRVPVSRPPRCQCFPVPGGVKAQGSEWRRARVGAGRYVPVLPSCSCAGPQARSARPPHTRSAHTGFARQCAARARGLLAESCFSDSPQQGAQPEPGEGWALCR